MVSESISYKRRSFYIEAAEERARIKRRMLEKRERVELDLVNEKLAARLREGEGSVMDSRESTSNREGYSVEPRHSFLENHDMVENRRVAEWVNSVVSERDHQSSHFSTQNLPNNDPPASIMASVDPRLGDVLIATMKILQEVSASGNNSNRLVNRLTTAKSLPPFSGDSLEWVRFKQAFETSSRLGAYSEAENVMRLYDALKGVAKEAVESLMVTNATPQTIMKTLELRFGNPDLVSEKIVHEIKKLPSLDSGKIDLISFATKVHNGATAMRSLNHVGYLCNPDLIREIINKLPPALIYSYNRHIHLNRSDEPRLIKLADFLLKEAEMECVAGTAQRVRKSKSVLATVAQESPNKPLSDQSKSQSKNKKENSCHYCNRKGHLINKCRKFENKSPKQRWFWVKNNRVCFKCLGKGTKLQIARQSHAL